MGTGLVSPVTEDLQKVSVNWVKGKNQQRSVENYPKVRHNTKQSTFCSAQHEFPPFFVVILNRPYSVLTLRLMELSSLSVPPQGHAVALGFTLIGVYQDGGGERPSSLGSEE